MATATTIAPFPPDEIDRIEASWTGTGAHFEPLVLGLIATIRDREAEAELDPQKVVEAIRRYERNEGRL